MIARGWLLDLYVHGDGLVLWFRLESGGLLRLTDSFYYRFYAQGPRPVLQDLAKKLAPYLPSRPPGPGERIFGAVRSFRYWK